MAWKKEWGRPPDYPAADEVRISATTGHLEVLRDGEWHDIEAKAQATTTPKAQDAAGSIAAIFSEVGQRIADLLGKPSEPEPAPAPPPVVDDSGYRVIERDGNGRLSHIQATLAAGHTLNIRIVDRNATNRISKMRIKADSGHAWNLEVTRRDTNNRIRELSLAAA